MKKKYSLLILFLKIILISSFCNADTVQNINITGNNRIQSETILEYGDIKTQKNYSNEDLNNLQKKIFATNFFETVSVSLINGNLLINVSENPLVNFFSLEGESNSDDSNKIYNRLLLSPGKIFTNYKLKQDLDFIKNYYLIKGYADSEVVPKVVKTSDNKVNILITVNKKNQSTINKIFFIGDKKFSTAELKDIITSSEYSWLKFLSNNTFFNIDRINYDKELLKKYYLNNGYYDAQISSAELKKIPNDKVNIIFSINSGATYNFGIINLNNDKNLLTQDAIQFIDVLKKKYLVGLFSLNKINIFTDKLNNYIGKNKIDFVNFSIKDFKNNNNIDLNIEFFSSDKIYINKINVTGNSITEEEVIRRNLKFSEGDSYIKFKIDRSIDELKSLRIFKDVKMNTANTSNNNVDIIVDVKEQPTGSISAGAGYGSNDGATIGFSIAEDNFLGKGVGLNTKFSIGSQKIEGHIGATLPDFMNSNKTLYSSFYSTKTDYTNTLFQSHKTGFDISSRYEIYDDIFIKPGIGFDYDKIDVDSSSSNYIKNQKGSFTTERVNYNIEKDSRNSKIATRDGSLLGFSQEYGTFFSTVPFIKSSLYGSTYFAISEKQTMNIKYGYSNISSINSNESVKLSDRLFVPYANTKGFQGRGYGPKDTSSDHFIGGNNFLYTSTSATIPNPVQESWNLNTILFANAFNLWGVDYSGVSDSSKIRSAVGLGIDWKSPIGPMNMSFSTPISKESTDKTKTFSFEIGTIF